MQFWNDCELLCGLKRSPLDRARRVLSMGIIYRFWSALWANRARHFKKYMIFSSFFCSISDFSPVCKGAGEKINSAFDRAHRVLSMIVIYRFWSGLWANPYRFFWRTVGFRNVLQFWIGWKLIYGLKMSPFDRARRILSMGIIYRFWSGLWANLYRFFWRTVGFQNCFAILDWLKADIWTKKESIG